MTDPVPSNVGHGHVFPRPDGVKARCGGPAMCHVCAADLARKNIQEVVKAGPVPSNETLSELFEYVVSLSHDMDVYHSRMLMQVAGVIGGVIASRAPSIEQRPSKERCNCPSGSYGIKHTTLCYEEQLVTARRTADYWKAEHLAGNAEIERLEVALCGIQSCSTCEACRGAATRALGGAAPEPEPTHFAFLIKRPRDKEAWPTIFDSRERAEGYEHRASPVVPVCLAQPPGVAQ